MRELKLARLWKEGDGRAIIGPMNARSYVCLTVCALGCALAVVGAARHDMVLAILGPFLSVGSFIVVPGR